MQNKSNDNRRSPEMPFVAAVVGPTASGKSVLAMELARRTGGEIISCDSMQIYKGMDIGTAKPSKAEREEIPHHLIDIITPAEEFSCAEYRFYAGRAVSEISARAKLPIFCGGTGLYLDGALQSERFSPDIDPSISGSLAGLSPEALYARLAECDPEAAAATHKNNVRRVIRALVIFIGTGITKSEWDRRSRRAQKRYKTVKIGLDFLDRENLYARIERRVDEMIAAGLVDEVKGLQKPICKTASQAIGYSEFFKYGFDDIPFVAERIKQNTRNYAKRQLTWFRRDPEINWFYLDCGDGGIENYKNIVNNAAELITAVSDVI